jgi:hypothetical protein
VPHQRLVVFHAAVLASCLLAPFAATQDRAPKTPGNVKQENAVHAEMRNVLYRFTDTVAVHIETLTGELIPIGSNEFPVFDDKESFHLRISAAQISISGRDMANALNSYVFARKDAPLKNISLAVQNGTLKVKGKLHDKGDVPFETDGNLSPTPDGKIRLHAENIKALHVPVKGLMDAFGVEVADLIHTGKVRGVQADKDDLLLDPEQILPPPHIEGKVASLHLQNDAIVLTFGKPVKNVAEGAAATNYMAYRGNRLRFGKLTMTDSDLTLIDMDPNDPFDFYLDHYIEQVAAGYTKVTPSFGLRVYTKDYAKLRTGQPAQNSSKSLNPKIPKIKD